MLSVRLQRVGRKNDPSFRMVIIDSKRGVKSANYVEMVGSYNPRQKGNTKINGERVKYWIAQGAKPTDTVHNLLISNKIIEGKKVNPLGKKTPITKEVENEEASKPEATDDDNVETETSEEAKTDTEEAPVSSEEKTVKTEAPKELKEEPDAPAEEEKKAKPEAVDNSKSEAAKVDSEPESTPEAVEETKESKGA